MSKAWSVAATVAVLHAASASAQDSVPPQDRWAQVAACAAERSNEARHACVDAVMRAAGVLDPAAEEAINRENFGRVERSLPPPVAPAVVAAPQSAPSAAPRSVAPPPTVNGIVTRVASARMGSDRRLQVTTTEGAVWQQDDTGTIRRLPREGESFEVREGALGSYRCTFNGNTTFRCERRD